MNKEWKKLPRIREAFTLMSKAAAKRDDAGHDSAHRNYVESSIAETAQVIWDIQEFNMSEKEKLVTALFVDVAKGMADSYSDIHQKIQADFKDLENVYSVDEQVEKKLATGDLSGLSPNVQLLAAVGTIVVAKRWNEVSPSWKTEYRQVYNKMAMTTAAGVLPGSLQKKRDQALKLIAA